jgi:hypothetical protein
VKHSASIPSRPGRASEDVTSGGDLSNVLMLRSPCLRGAGHERSQKKHTSDTAGEINEWQCAAAMAWNTWRQRA